MKLDLNNKLRITARLRRWMAPSFVLSESDIRRKVGIGGGCGGEPIDGWLASSRNVECNLLMMF